MGRPTFRAEPLRGTSLGSRVPGARTIRGNHPGKPARDPARGQGGSRPRFPRPRTSPPQAEGRRRSRPCPRASARGPSPSVHAGPRRPPRATGPTPSGAGGPGRRRDGLQLDQVVRREWRDQTTAVPRIMKRTPKRTLPRGIPPRRRMGREPATGRETSIAAISLAAFTATRASGPCRRRPPRG